MNNEGVMVAGVAMLPTRTIVENAVLASSVSTLVAAVQAAGLVDTLNGAGPFTVFAPTNAAFAKLPKATVEALLKDKEALKKVLTYHVLDGVVTGKDVIGMGGKGTPKTVNGAMLNVTTIDGAIYVNDARVIKGDIVVGNGVIHAIDTVLLPK